MAFLVEGLVTTVLGLRMRGCHIYSYSGGSGCNAHCQVVAIGHCTSGNLGGMLYKKHLRVYLELHRYVYVYIWTVKCNKTIPPALHLQHTASNASGKRFSATSNVNNVPKGTPALQGPPGPRENHQSIDSSAPDELAGPWVHRAASHPLRPCH